LSPKREALQLLGIARRAGSVVVGTRRTREALRRGGVALVVIAADAAAGQVAKVEGLIRAQGLPRVRMGDRSALGRAVGGPPVSAVAVTDRRLAETIVGALSDHPDGIVGHEQVELEVNPE
jgi:ribosomal protein L7Ae-like RNA K-turn-binding protein